MQKRGRHVSSVPDSSCMAVILPPPATATRLVPQSTSPRPRSSSNIHRQHAGPHRTRLLTFPPASLPLFTVPSLPRGFRTTGTTSLPPSRSTPRQTVATRICDALSSHELNHEVSSSTTPAPGGAESHLEEGKGPRPDLGVPEISLSRRPWFPLRLADAECHRRT